jgi:uncharacterized protein YutD
MTNYVMAYATICGYFIINKVQDQLISSTENGQHMDNIVMVVFVMTT